MHQFLRFIYFEFKHYMFWSVFPSIIRSSRLHTATGIRQTYCYLLAGVPASKQVAVSVCHVCCCMYSLELLMMDGKTDRDVEC
jgi:hypothetical protein